MFNSIEFKWLPHKFKKVAHSADFTFGAYDKARSLVWGYDINNTIFTYNKNNVKDAKYTFVGIVDIRGMFVTKSGTILVMYRPTGTNCRIARSTNGTTFTDVYDFGHSSNLLDGWCEHPELGIFLGEYPPDGSTNTIKLLRSTNDGLSWTVAKSWDFYWNGVGVDTGDHIRHIHGTMYDPVENLIWITTGDMDSQCRVYTFDGSTFQLIGGGNQSWRYVSVAFLFDYVILPTDDGWQGGRIFRINRYTRIRDEYTERMNDLSWYSVNYTGSNFTFVFTQPWKSDNNSVDVYVVYPEKVVHVGKFKGVENPQTGNVNVSIPIFHNNSIYLNLHNIEPDINPSQWRKYAKLDISQFAWRSTLFN